MAKREIVAGIADQTVDVFIQDSSSTVGAGLTGLVFNTANLVCYYRKGATGTPTALTLATQTVGGAHSDGGFVAVDGTNCPGQYRLDLSDTIVAAAGMVVVYLRGAANMVPCVLEIEVVSVNKFDAVRMGLTSLPNAAAEAAGGLYTRGTGAGQINQPANGMVDANVVRNAGTALTAAAGIQEVKVASIAASAVTAAAIAADAITAAKIADGAIDAATFAAGAITPTAVSAALPANLTQMFGDAAPAQWLAEMSWLGTAATGTLSTTQMTSSLTGYGDDLFNYKWAIYFGTGAAAQYQQRIVTDYVSATGMFTFPALTTPPVNGDAFFLFPAATGEAVGDRTGALSGAVGSVTGAVGSVAAAVTVGTINAGVITATAIADGALTAAKFAAGAFDAVWTVAVRTLTAFDAAFKTGYALSSAGVQAIWDALTSALTTVGSIGKWLLDNIANRASQTSVDDLPTNAELAAALVTYGGPVIPGGTVTTDAGNSATSFETSRTESVNDYWKDALLLITSGALAGQVKKVTAYNGTTKIVTVSGGFTGTPADGVTFLLVNR